MLDRNPDEKGSHVDGLVALHDRTRIVWYDTAWALRGTERYGTAEYSVVCEV